MQGAGKACVSRFSPCGFPLRGAMGFGYVQSERVGIGMIDDVLIYNVHDSRSN